MSSLTPNPSWAEGRMVAFDTETTGVDTESDRIVSAAVVAVGGGQPTETHSWLADPGVEVPEAAARVHGITTDRARAEGASPVEVVEQITRLVAEHLAGGVPLVVFNARFDLTLLDREARRHGLVPLVERLVSLDLAPVLDPLVIDRQIDRYRRGSRKLSALATHYRIPQEPEGAHTAEVDAMTAARLAWRLGTAHRQVGESPLLRLHDAQVTWAARQAAGLEEYLRRTNPDAVVNPAWPYLPHTLIDTESSPS